MIGTTSLNSNNQGVPIASSVQKQLITIQGTLTSQIQSRGEEKEPYYYAFVRLKGQRIDLPVIFKVKDDQENSIKPTLKKSDQVELTGYYSTSEKSVRKSFTTISYQPLNHKRVRKKPDDYLNQQEDNRNIFTK